MSLLASSLFSGFSEAILLNPFEIVKVGMQNEAKLSNYKNSGDALIKIIASKGIKKLYHGYNATMLRHSIWNMGYFGTFPYVMPLFINYETSMSQKFIVGLICGVVGTFMNNPIDVVKTRRQADLNNKTNTLYSIAKILHQTEGFRAFFKGIMPKLLRYGPGGGVMLLVNDYILRKLMG